MKKYKKYIGFIMLASFILSFSLAKAGNGTNREETNNTGTSQTDNKREVLKKDLKEMQETFKKEREVARKAFTEKLKKDRETFLKELKTRKEEFKQLKDDMKLKFCDRVKDMTTRRFEVAISKLTEAQTKVSALITKLDAENKDTATAKELLELSKKNLADAKTKLAEVKSLVPEGGCKDITPEIFEKIKLGAREAKNLLKSSKENLHQALKEIRNLKKQVEGEDDDTENNSAETQQ